MSLAKTKLFASPYHFGSVTHRCEDKDPIPSWYDILFLLFGASVIESQRNLEKKVQKLWSQSVPAYDYFC